MAGEAGGGTRRSPAPITAQSYVAAPSCLSTAGPAAASGWIRHTASDGGNRSSLAKEMRPCTASALPDAQAFWTIVVWQTFLTSSTTLSSQRVDLLPRHAVLGPTVGVHRLIEDADADTRKFVAKREADKLIGRVRHFREIGRYPGGSRGGQRRSRLDKGAADWFYLRHGPGGAP